MGVTSHMVIAIIYFNYSDFNIIMSFRKLLLINVNEETKFHLPTDLIKYFQGDGSLCWKLIMKRIINKVNGSILKESESCSSNL